MAGELAVDKVKSMAESALSRASVSGDTEMSGYIFLVETHPSAQSPSNPRPSDRNVIFEVSPDLRQACQTVTQGTQCLVIAGPRLDALRLDGLGTAIGGPSVELHSLLSKLPPIYQVQDAKNLLAGLVETVANAIGPQPIFALLCDRVTGEPDLGSLCTHNACRPDLAETLGRYFDPREILSDVAGLRSAKEHGTRTALPESPGTDMGPWLWMVPLIHHSRLEALLGVASWEQADEPGARSLGMLRLLSMVSAPFLAELRDKEGLRRTTDELEAALQIKSHLMSNVCHEFRSLLAVVRGYCKRILDGRTGAISDVQRDELAVVLRNTNKLLDLVSHSLPFVAEQQLRVESFDLREIWQGALKRMRRQASEKSIRIQEQIPSEIFTVTADRARLAIVFELVLASAIQCAAPGGEITAQLLRGASGEVTVRLFAAGARLPAHILDGLFDHSGESLPFASRPDGQRIAGLSFVHDMVWLHGGRIAVMSSEEEGTVFIFTLPPPPKLGQNSTDSGISNG